MSGKNKLRTGITYENPIELYGGLGVCPVCSKPVKKGATCGCPMLEVAQAKKDQEFKWFAKITASDSIAEPSGPDKSMIWEDCPACAYKHLTAAYAGATIPGIEEPLYAHIADVMAARSVIANRECEAGYTGNRALAAGCLAFAETCFGVETEQIKEFREARLALGKDFEDHIVPPLPAALIGAHISEALRELPSLAHRTYIDDLFTNGNFDPESLQQLRDWLRESIKWVWDEYELGEMK